MFLIKKLAIFIGILFISTSIFSQVYDPEKINKKAIEVYNKAMEELQYGEVKKRSHYF